MGRARQYLGDGVVAENDGFQIKLIADGTKVVYLGPGELRALVAVATAWGLFGD